MRFSQEKKKSGWLIEIPFGQQKLLELRAKQSPQELRSAHKH